MDKTQNQSFLTDFVVMPLGFPEHVGENQLSSFVHGSTEQVADFDFRYLFSKCINEMRKIPFSQDVRLSLILSHTRGGMVYVSEVDKSDKGSDFILFHVDNKNAIRDASIMTEEEARVALDEISQMIQLRELVAESPDAECDEDCEPGEDRGSKLAKIDAIIGEMLDKAKIRIRSLFIANIPTSTVERTISDTLKMMKERKVSIINYANEEKSEATQQSTQEGKSCGEISKGGD